MRELCTAEMVVMCGGGINLAAGIPGGRKRRVSDAHLYKCSPGWCLWDVRREQCRERNADRGRRGGTPRAAPRTVIGSEAWARPTT